MTNGGLHDDGDDDEGEVEEIKGKREKGEEKDARRSSPSRGQQPPFDA